MFIFNMTTGQADDHNYSTTKGVVARLEKLKTANPDSSLHIVDLDLVTWEFDQEDSE